MRQQLWQRLGGGAEAAGVYMETQPRMDAVFC